MSENAFTANWWTDSARAFAEKAWKAGVSARKIARQLGEPFTNNMIIGMARRQGWGRRSSPIVRYAPGEKRMKPKRLPRPKRQLPKIPARFPFCQWIEGEPTREDDCKCRKPCSHGAYCEEHYRRAYSRGPA